MNIVRTQWGVRGAVNGKHTHPRIHSVPRNTQGGSSLGKKSDAILTHVSVARPIIKLMRYEHREDAVGVRGAGNEKHTKHTHTHTPHSVHRDTSGGESLLQ